MPLPGGVRSPLARRYGRFVATTLTVDEHLAALGAASLRLERDAREAGEAARVPTCPGWDARDLLAHIVMVHEWAAAHIGGEDAEQVRSESELRASDDDLLQLFSTGSERLVSALRESPDDLDAMVFLHDAPGPRAFWARRQAHETTIHAVDALAARLGRPPASAEVPISTDLALDGIDELLLGFVPRGRSHWSDVEPFTLTVRPDDGDRCWRLRIDSERIRAAEEADPNADVVLSGSAVALYVGLWNRGDEIVQTGSTSALETWHSVQRVRWS